jgi:hypothetical protein
MRSGDFPQETEEFRRLLDRRQEAGDPSNRRRGGQALLSAAWGKSLTSSSPVSGLVVSLPLVRRSPDLIRLL